ncbi:MAG: hypothetical protein ACOCXJ_04940 [Planctomycetota bacterium]
MEPYQSSIDAGAQRVVTVWSGPVTDRALYAYQDQVWCDPTRAHFDELLDFRQAASVSVSSEGLRTVAGMAVRKDRPEAHSRLALVIDGDLQFGLSRMYESLRSVQEHSARAVRIFHDADTARSWLDTPREWRGEGGPDS